MADEGNSDEEQGATVARNSTVDAVVAVCLVVIGLVVVVEARRLGAGWSTDGPGSGYFPFYIGAIMAISGIGILVQALLARKSDTSVFVDSVQLRRVGTVIVPSLVYAGAIMLLGIYIASALFIALFMIVLGKYPVVKGVTVGVVVNALFFAMFEMWFKVPLYKGVLDPLRFLGY